MQEITFPLKIVGFLAGDNKIISPRPELRIFIGENDEPGAL